MAETLTQNALAPDELPPQFPDHTQLPESDGSFVKNFQEHPQSLILTDSIGITLERLHPDGQYAIGQDCGIYWRETDPPEKGAEAPDWFYVPNVPPRLRGAIRRSYVLWREFIAPTIALEFASGNGSEEYDQTPLSYSEEGGTTRPGKFWVYEQIMRIPYYGIFFINSGELEMYELVGGQYQQMIANSRGHYLIPQMEVEVGVWEGAYQNQTQPWLRWWDVQGDLLLTGSEQAVVAEQRAESAEEKAARLAERLREMGIDPDLI
ncbi:MAG: Uma2 family endonuclease [Drouetiella hepatica Uher 2000/2452]|jgi:Uma2 family endonuclease|uniref:Uma2 family endonuclease n=1 Tax=Drouetiella hepatica Uher 2000/2452 TaxID=904376 RepID=A0A951QEZ6_9CYAN|nr:Uma2 family endonuclease [Drouetiella hepatica Uher 2000/2452]